MGSRGLQPCSGRDISHLINWQAGRKPIGAPTKGNRMKDVLLALNAGEMGSGKVQCNSAKYFPESPWLRGLCFKANLTQTGSWGVLSAFQSAQRKFQQSGGLEVSGPACYHCEEGQVTCQLPSCLGPCPEKWQGQWSGWQLPVSKGQLSSLTLKRNLLGFTSAL